MSVLYLPAYDVPTWLLLATPVVFAVPLVAVRLRRFSRRNVVRGITLLAICFGLAGSGYASFAVNAPIPPKAPPLQIISVTAPVATLDEDIIAPKVCTNFTEICTSESCPFWPCWVYNCACSGGGNQ